MTTLAKAYAALNPKQPLVSFQVERREPGPHDVQIEIFYCGVCHSDVHQVNNDWGFSQFPIVPGHEIVGKVTKIGDKVTRHKVGDPVGVGCMVDSCRECSSCQQHLEQYCEQGCSWTYSSLEQDKKTLTYGGYSTQVVVNEDFVLSIPKNLPLDEAAPLLCAGITTFSPLNKWKIKKGDKVGVIGLGGLGHVAVKIAVAMGAEVTVISRSNAKKEDALRFGAKHYLNTSEPEALAKSANQFNYILNTVSAVINLTPYLNLLKLDGSLVQVGIPDKPNAVDSMALISQRRNLTGSLIGGIAETQEMLDFCGKHNITAEIEKISLPQINNAYERMLHGEVRYRFVIDLKL